MEEHFGGDFGAFESSRFTATGSAGIQLPRVKLAKISRRESIADVLRGEIMRGDLKPGQRLRESQLAQSLGVSQVSVREALQVLENQGLAIKYPNRGTFVIEFSLEEIVESVRLRTVLETRAALRAQKKITADDETRLRRIVTTMEEFRDAGKHYEMIITDLEFHSAIWKIARNRPLERVLRGLVYPLFAFYHLIHLPELKAEPLSESHKVHHAIVDALIYGDSDLLAQAVRRAIVSGRIARLLEEFEKRESSAGTGNSLLP